MNRNKLTYHTGDKIIKTSEQVNTVNFKQVNECIKASKTPKKKVEIITNVSETPRITLLGLDLQLA